MTADVLALVPARSGSEGLAHKNVRRLAGRTLLEHTIDLLRTIPEIGRIVVSTDADAYREMATAAGAEAPFRRPEELSGKYASTEDTLKHALQWLAEHDGYEPDIVVYQQVNDLFKRREWIVRCIEALVDHPELDTAFVAMVVHKNFWIEEDGRFVRLSHEGHVARQLKRPIFREDTGLACATRPRLILEEGRRIGDRVEIIPHETFSIDIHDDFDWALAELVTERFPELRALLASGDGATDGTDDAS